MTGPALELADSVKVGVDGGIVANRRAGAGVAIDRVCMVPERVAVTVDLLFSNCRLVGGEAVC